MAAFDCIFGNAGTVASLKMSIRSGKVAASYIVAGPEMSGKYTLTKEFACALTEKLTSENAAIMCKKIRGGISPDITVCDPEEKRSIGVEDIRDVFGTVYTTPNELEFRMFVVRGADRLTAQAQNALLKVFEEPPAGAYIFLLCESRAKLLPTLISRAQNIDVETFDKTAMDRYFGDRYDTSSENAAIAYLLSHGALGKAEQLLSDDEGVETYRSARELLDSVMRKDSFGSLDLCQKTCQTREACFFVTELLSDAVGDMINFMKKTDSETRFFIGRDDLQCFASKTDLSRLATLLGSISSLRENLDFNANPTSTAAALFIALKRCFID